MTRNNYKKANDTPKSLNVSNINEGSEVNDSPKLFRNTEFIEIKASPSLFKLSQNRIDPTQYHSIAEMRMKQKLNIKNPFLHRLWGQLLHKFGILK